jgi:hypothetical protein
MYPHLLLDFPQALVELLPIDPVNPELLLPLLPDILWRIKAAPPVNRAAAREVRVGYKYL